MSFADFVTLLGTAVAVVGWVHIGATLFGK